MVKTLQLKLVLLLCMLVVGVSNAWAQTTYKLTQVTSVEAGSYYVFEQGGHVMNNTVSSSALQTTDTYSTTGLTRSESYVWKLETATNGFYMRNMSLSANQYLNNSSGTGVSFSNNKSSIWSVTFTDGKALIQNKSNSDRFLGYTSSTSYAYKAYATSNLTSTTYPHDITVYKLEEETAPAYTITAQSNNTSYGTVSLSGTVITGSPNSGYRYADPAYTVSPANSATVSQEGNDFTVTPSANTTVTINFEAIPCYTVTLGDNSATLTEESGGAGVTLPSRSNVGSYTFAGWVTSNIATETTTAPSNIISAGTYYPTANITLYPIYTKVVAGGGTTHETASVTVSEYATANSWGSSSSADQKSITINSDVTATCNDGTNSGKYYSDGWRIYQTETGKITISTTSGELTSVTFTFTVSNTGTLNYNSSAITSGTAVDVSGTSAEFTVGNSGTATNGQVRITAISVNYDVTGGSTTYYWSAPVAAAVETPVIAVADNPFLFSTTATITCATDGATIKYSYDNNTWSDYTQALTITETKTIYAKAVKGNDESSVAQVTATKNLATPTVTVSGDLTLDLDGGTDVSAGTLTAAVTYNESAVTGATVTWSSSDNTIATIDASGAVTIKSTGEVTFTATYAGNSDYAEATGTKTVTVVDSNAPGSTQQNPYTVAQAITAIQALPNNNATSEKYYVSGIVSAFYENATGIMSASNKRYYISDDGTTATQLLVYNGKGLNNEAFSSDDDLLIGDRVIIYGSIQYYQGSTPEIASGNYIVSLNRTKQDPTIVVNSTEIVAYGSTFTVDDTMIEGGDITVTSGNTNVATVNGLDITPVAVGTTTITVATAENLSYNAGSETFELTVTAPAGQTTAPSGGTSSVLFSESFGEANSATDWNDNYSVKGGVSEVYENVTYDVTNARLSKNTMGYEGSALMSGQGSVGTFIVGPLKVADYSGLNVSNKFKMSSSSWSNNSYMKLSYTTNGTDYVEVNRTDNNTPTGASSYFDATYDLPVAAQSNNLYLKFEFYCYQLNKNDLEIGQLYFDNLTLSGSSSAAYTETVKLNASGYATYCSEYPLDFTDYDTADYSAWQIKDISSPNNGTCAISFEQITGKVKGGTGVLLKGTASADVEIASSDSDNELTSNLLVGTTAPTYIATPGTVYGLNGNTFVKNSVAGTIPANRAYIDANDIPSSAKSFTFVFENDVTGISETVNVSREEVEKIFNLGGQRLNKMQRGINIVNGKKVMVK